MAGSIRVRTELADGAAEVRVLIRHPMETGRRRTDAGALVPAHYIERFECAHNGTIVLSAHWGTGVSKNPFVAFRLRGARAGDRLSLCWVDNRGERDELVTEL